MPVFLDRMPFPAEATAVAVGGERVHVKKNQIIVWMSLSRLLQKSPNPTAVPFPAILDTGHTHSFSIQAQHLQRWAGLRPENLTPLGTIREGGRRLQLHSANLWVHSNRRRLHQYSTDASAHMLVAPYGIAVYPDGGFPRLPLLGVRALVDNDLVLKIRGRKREATLRTRRRWWPFD